MEKQKKQMKDNRAKQTRRMILDAAAQVFATHPYNAASIRMIAAQGGFYHGLIRYHFPSKAAIFEAVTKEACDALYLANKEWLNEISGLGPDKALSIYLDRFIAFAIEKPSVTRIVINNISHDDPARLPGYRNIEKLLADTRRDFEETFPTLFSKSDAVRFLSSLNALLVHFIGARRMEAPLLGFRGDDTRYLAWVKQTLFFIFHPVLKNAADSATKK